MPILIPSQRAKFEIPPDVTYLNCAYMSPQALPVRSAGLEAIALKAQPWKIRAEDFFSSSNRLRDLFAQIVGCKGQDVALVPSVSYGIGVAAANIPFSKGQKVIVIQDQFPSNVYPWIHLAQQKGGRVETVPRPPDGNWSTRIMDAIDSSTGVVALPICHWTDGSLVDIERIGALCRMHGVPLVIDATQSLGAMPFNIDQVKPAFLVAAGYKWLMGPYSLGYLYVDPAYQNGIPLEHNWITREGSENFAGLVHYTDKLSQGATRFDMGERSNFSLVPMAIRALEMLISWGIENIAYTLGQYNQEIAESIEPYGAQLSPREYVAPHMMGLRFPDGIPGKVVNALSENQIFVSVRGDAIRVAPHLYNDERDKARFIDCLRAELKHH